MGPGCVQRVLLVHKKSPQPGFLLESKGGRLSALRDPFVQMDLRRARAARECHERTFQEVQQALRRAGVRYRAVERTWGVQEAPYDLIISVGGDGTFLEAARGARRRPVLGVNSDPRRSAGSFCCADRRSFPALLAQILRGSARLERLNRLRMTLNGRPLPVEVLNDLLVTDRTPAAMSRYWLRIGRLEEEQRSSGLWIATAAGSSGAILSAGGKRIPRGSSLLQYRPRELYRGLGRRYRLTGGAIRPRLRIQVGSLMANGLICVDGEHVKFPFRYADLLELRPSPHPLLQVLPGRPRG